MRTGSPENKSYLVIRAAIEHAAATGSSLSYRKLVDATGYHESTISTAIAVLTKARVIENIPGKKAWRLIATGAVFPLSTRRAGGRDGTNESPAARCCLGCARQFESRWIGNRLCLNCSSRVAGGYPVERVCPPARVKA